MFYGAALACWDRTQQGGEDGDKEGQMHPNRMHVSKSSPSLSSKCVCMGGMQITDSSHPITCTGKE